MYPDRRRSVRHKVNGPAFAIFDGVTGGMILDLSEEGLSMQAPDLGALSAAGTYRPIKMQLDFPDSALQLETTGYIAWADALGRAGVRFSDLPEESRQRLDEWLTFNDAAPSRRAPKVSVTQAPRSPYESVPRLDSITLTVEPENGAAFETAAPGCGTVQYEFAQLAADLNAALRVIAEKARSLTRGSGAAIALAHKDSLMCRASVGTCAPALGTKLDSNSRFSWECIRSRRALRCDDALNHLWIDAESVAGFGLRSILAAPVEYEREVIGLLEVYSAQAHAFDDGDLSVVERLARTVLLTLGQPTRPARG